MKEGRRDTVYRGTASLNLGLNQAQVEYTRKLSPAKSLATRRSSSSLGPVHLEEFLCLRLDALPRGLQILRGMLLIPVPTGD